MREEPGTIVTYPEDLKWEAVGPLDENGKGIFVLTGCEFCNYS
jgi:hypothetical protein